jgi:transcriptional regulator with XRE-family HTH domain
MGKDNEVKQVIAARIKAARKAAGLSQGQVAKKLDMHRPTISEIEAGRRSVTSDELGRFATLFGVETWWLSCADPEEERQASLAKYQIAARHLSKMKDEDFDILMRLLSSLKPTGGLDDAKK